MSLRTVCTHCEATLNVADTLKGKMIRCPKCKELTRVPGGQAKPTAMAGKPKPSVDDDTPPPPTKSANFKPAGKSAKKTMLAADEGIMDRKKTAPMPGPRKPKKTQLARDLDDEVDDRPARKPASRRDDDEDTDDRPVRKPASRRDDNEDTDDRPVRKPVSRRGEDDDVDERPTRRGSRRRIEDDDDAPKAKKSPMIWIGAGAGALVLVAGIVVTIFMMKGSGDQKQIAQNQPPAMNVNQPPAVPVPADNKLPNAGSNPNPMNPVAVPLKNPDPVANPIQAAPPPVVAQVPAGPAPADIDRTTTLRVKKATVYVKVKAANKETWSGSGFFAVESGIIFTNAHVVGMLTPGAAPPKELDIFVNSGQKADEFKLTGMVLGVDRENDLAVVRVTGDLARCPPPLPVELGETSLTELQKVFIFGFPHGESLGKEITVSSSSVSSFRRDVDGALYQIQVNGGMHPGNSGGPVIDTRGVVIGVSVAGIPGTQINFAVPGEKIQGMLHGRVQECMIGEPFSDNNAIKLPIKVACLDPLNRLRDVKLDVWTGPAGPARPAGLKAPAQLPGDSIKQTVALKYNGGLGAHDLLIPTLTLPPGHVYWIQPTLVTNLGVQQWGATTTLDTAGLAPLNRVPANLTFSTATAQRNLDIAGKFEFSMIKGKQKIIDSDDLNFQVLEEMTNDPKGTALRVAMGKGSFTFTDGKKVTQRVEAAQTMVKRKIFSYATDGNGRLERFGFPQFRPVQPPYNPKSKAKLPPPPNYTLQQLINFDEAEDMASMFNSTYQLSSLSVPNRPVQPLEVWDAKISMLIGTGKKKDTLDLLMKYTYEGSRTVNGKTEALVTITGEVERRQKQPGSDSRPKSKIIGQGSFDVAGGFFSKLKVTIRAEGEYGGTHVARIFEVNLKRTAGNGYNIGPLPPRNPGPGTNPTAPVAAGDRKLWRSGTVSTFTNDQAKRWVEAQPGKPSNTFEEVSRTDAFIEIRDAGRKMSVRLYADHSEFRGDGQAAWTRLYEGGWVSTAASPNPNPGPGPAPAKGPAPVVGDALKTTLVPGVQADKLVGDLIWTSNAAGFFALTSDGALSRVSLSNLAVEKQVNLGPGCNFLAMSGQGLLVAKKDVQEVWLVNPDTLEVKKKMPAPSIHCVLSAPGLAFAIVTMSNDPRGRNNQEVGYLDLAQGKITNRFKINIWHGRISPDGKYYFCQSGIEQLTKYRIDGNNLVADGASDRIATNGSSIGVSPDSKLVCLPAGGGNGKGYITNIYKMEDLKTPMCVLSAGAFPRVVGFDPAAKLIYTQNNSFHLVVFSMDGVKLKEFMPSREDRDTRQLVAHPQGKKLLLATAKRLFLVELQVTP